ncbi:hypothetical protein J7L48_06410, partial [bacterium]|nr:hypothetical protein [bacterium]
DSIIELQLAMFKLVRFLVNAVYLIRYRFDGAIYLFFECILLYLMLRYFIITFHKAEKIK